MRRQAELDVLDEDDYMTLVRVAAHSPSPCRDRALVHLFWHLAPPVRRVLDLRLEDFRADEGQIRWGDRPGVAAPTSLLQALGTYVRVERIAPRGVPYLFCGRHGRKMDLSEMAGFFRRLSRTAGFPVDPLTLRRAAFERALRNDPARALGVLRTHAQPTGGPSEEAPAPEAACSLPSST